MGHPDHSHEQENLKQPGQNPTDEYQKSVQTRPNPKTSLLTLLEYLWTVTKKKSQKPLPLVVCAKNIFSGAVSLLSGSAERRVQTDTVMLVIKELFPR